MLEAFLGKSGEHHFS